MKDQHESLDEIRSWLRVFGKDESRLSPETFETWSNLQDRNHFANNATGYEQQSQWHEQHGFTMERIREGGEPLLRIPYPAAYLEKIQSDIKSQKFTTGISGTKVKKSSKESGKRAISSILNSLNS